MKPSSGTLARLRTVRLSTRPTIVPRLTHATPCAPVLASAHFTRTLTSTAPLAKTKKKKGNDKGNSEPPADVEGQLDLDKTHEQMKSIVSKCKESVHGLIGSFGRVDPSLLDPVRVQYGKDAKATPLHDYATVGVRDGCLMVTAYDESSVKHIERGIYAAKLDLSPRLAPEEGPGVIIVPVPKPTGETRKALMHKCSEACEQARIHLRSERHTAQKQLKHDLDNKVVSKDTMQKESKRLEELNKSHTTLIDRLAEDAQKQLQHSST